MYKQFLSALFAVLVWCGSASASDVVFDQSPGANTSGSLTSSTLDLLGGTPGYRSADDFSIAGGATITDVHWWGGFGASTSESFTFTFYADDAGEPGSVLLTTTGSLASSSVSPGTLFDPLTFYSSILADPFSASAGTTYWLSIFNDAADASWGWWGANTAFGNSALQQTNGSSTWNPYFITDRLAFQLTGTSSSVPEPATLALLGLGLLGLGFARRRKQ